MKTRKEIRIVIEGIALGSGGVAGPSMYWFGLGPKLAIVLEDQWLPAKPPEKKKPRWVEGGEDWRVSPKMSFLVFEWGRVSLACVSLRGLETGGVFFWEGVGRANPRCLYFE